MDISKYIKSLLPVIKVDDVKADVQATLVDLTSQTIPPYQDSITLFDSKYQFKHNWTKDKAKRFDSGLQRFRDKRLGMIEQLTKILISLEPRLKWILDRLDNITSGSISRESITYPVAILLHLSEMYKWIVSYSRKLLLCFYAYETDAVLNKKGDFPYPPAELKKIEDNYNNYINILVSISTYTSDETDKLYSAIPDVTYADNDAIYQSKSNTLGVNFLSPSWNPIYHIRLYIVEWQAANYNAAKAEREALGLRAAKLKEVIATGDSDANTDDILDKVEERLRTVNYRIKQMEEKYG